MSLPQDFWDECVALGVVVVPFTAYSRYVDGNLHDSARIGLRFVCIASDPEAIAAQGEFWLYVDDAASDVDLIADSPEMALAKYRNQVKP